MKTYRIQNRATGGWWNGEAESAQEACGKAGWLIADCWVREQTPVVADPSTESGHRGGGWKNTPTIEINLDAKCRQCGEDGATQNGLCLNCISKAVKAKKGASMGTAVKGPTQRESQAEGRKLHIQQLAVSSERNFLKIGKLLLEAREEMDWEVYEYGSFKDYILNLELPNRMSYSYATKLVGIYEHIMIGLEMTEDELAEIGVSKLSRVVGLARDGKITREEILALKDQTDMEVRDSMESEDEGGQPTSPLITCQRCGAEISVQWLKIHGYVYKKKEAQTPATA